MGRPDYKRLVYSFESPGGDAFFAVLDPYYLTADVPTPHMTGTFDNSQLTGSRPRWPRPRQPISFFSHGPYYYVNHDPPALLAMTQLWNILDNNHFDLYCCGHSHLYSRKTIDRSIAPNPQLNPPIQWQ